MTFKAKYHGRCGSCGIDVAGDVCRTEDDGVIVHDDCSLSIHLGDDEPEWRGHSDSLSDLDRDMKRPVCTEHFLLQPCGDCEVT